MIKLWFCFLNFHFVPCFYEMCLNLFLASWGLEIMTDCHILRIVSPTSLASSQVRRSLQQQSISIYLFCSKGGPRLANCGRKKVFNNATGQCSDPKNVPGWWVDTLVICILLIFYSETYWIEKLKDEDSDEYYYDDY